MSESDKMGLFGSKDEINDKTSEENENSDKSKETSSENFAPYNIDSDSETYDTEALSMMDINDIIGVQGDTPGESTLESEFAALSEIITDSKDEFVLQDKSADKKTSIVEDCDEEGEIKNNMCDMKKSKDSAGATSINKSLQLIGEAYISEDSQETDNEDMQDRAVKKSTDTSVTCETIKNSDEDTPAMSTKESNEVENSTPEEHVMKEIVSGNDNSCNIGEPSSESAKESSKSATIVESADSTDSISVEAKEKSEDDNVESMIVDPVTSSDILEKLPAEALSKSDKNDDTKIAESSEFKDLVDETQEVEQKIESVDSDEPMEIKESDATLVIIEKPPMIEIPMEVNVIEEESNSSTSVKRTLESAKEKSELEQLKNPIIEESESERSKQSVEESIIEENQTEKPDTPVEKSEIEKNEREESKEASTKLQRGKTDEASTKQESEIKKDSDGPEGGENTANADALLVASEDVAEPMEIDDRDEEQNETDKLAEVVPKIAENSIRNDERVSDCLTPNQINEENAEKPSNIVTKSPEISKAVEKDSFPDLKSKESSEDNSVLAGSEFCENTTKVVDVIPVELLVDITSRGSTAGDTEDEKMEIDGLPKEKFVEKIEGFEVHVSPKEIQVSTTKKEKNEEIVEKKCSIDTVDDAVKTSPECDKYDPILDESVKNLNESKKDEKDVLVEKKHVASSIDNVEIQEIETTGLENDKVEEQRKSEISILDCQSSNSEDCQLEKARAIEEEMQQSKENAEADVNEELKESNDKTAIFVEKIESSEEARKIENTNVIEIIVDKSVENEKNENETILKTEKNEIQIEKTECSEGKNEEIEVEELIDDALEIEKIQAQSISNEEEKNNKICSDSSNKKDKKVFTCFEKAASPNEEDTGKSLTSVEAEFSTGEENLIPSNKTECSKDTAEDILEAHGEIESSNLQENACSAKKKPSSEEKNVICPENAESSHNEDTSTSLSSLNVEEKTDAASEEIESVKCTENEIFDEKFSENVESSIDCSDEIEETKLPVELPEETPETDKGESFAESEEKFSTSIPEKIDNIEITSKPEEEIFSKPTDPSDELIKNILPNSSANSPNVVIEKDQVIEEMNLKIHPEIFEAPENSSDKGPARASPDQIYVNQKEENDNNTETSMIVQEKEDERNSVQLDDCAAQSLTYKSEDNDEETQEKDMEDTEDNYASVTEIFQDDEQSQSTQEMMVSILETDKGNINKILDDQEADDLETSAMNDITKLPNESEDMLNKALADPMTTQNIDSLEGLLDLDLMPDNDESNLKSVEPIVDKVIEESCDDIETIGKNVDVSLLMEENDTIENSDRNDNYNPEVASKIMNNDNEESIEPSIDNLMNTSTIEVNRKIEESTELTEKDLEAFDLASVVTNPLESVDPTEETKIDLAEDLLREIAVDEERKIDLTEKLLLEENIQEQDLLLSTAIQRPTKIDLPDEVFLPVESERDMELTEDISLDSAVRDQVLNEVAAEMDNLAPNSEISELESAVKFLQESEEQDMDSPLVLSPKMVEDVVNDIAENSNVGIFSTDTEICEDPSVLVAELESIIPDPIAISEAEIINEAAKLETERRTKISQETNITKITPEIAFAGEFIEAKSSLVESSKSSSVPEDSERCDNNEKHEEIILQRPDIDEIEREPLKKSVPIPKISILEERLKIPPKIEIPVGEVTRMCELPTTPKTSLLIQRDVRTMNLMKQLESPKSMEKSELKIVDTPRKDNEKYDFENVGSPRIILKIAKSAIADCSEPRSPKSPKIRSATNSPNPEDSPGQKLGKIKLKLSKGGHPSIISNDNIDDNCGQWHTEGSSSLSPLGMKIKFSKIPENPNAQTDKHENDDNKEQTVKHKFEEARRTESPLGMKIKLSKTGEPSIVQQETKDSGTKYREKIDVQHDSPKRTESSIGMKIKLSKSGDASIIQPEKQEIIDEHKDGNSRSKETSQQHCDRSDTSRRTESPLGMKFKIFKTGDASIVQTEAQEENQQDVKRTDSPVGKRIKLSKTRGNTPVSTSDLNEDTKQLELLEEPKRTDSPLGMKIKLSKSGDASIIHNEEIRDANKHKAEIVHEATQIVEGGPMVKTKMGKSSMVAHPEVPPDNEIIAGPSKRGDTIIGMKIKLSKSGDASIVHPENSEYPEETRIKEKSDGLQENIRKIDSPIGMKIKLSKSGDASIVQSQSSKKLEDQSLESRETESSRTNEAQTAVKTKIQKNIEAAIVETEKKEKSARRRDTESPLEMKIKLSKTGHPTIVACDNYNETQQRAKDTMEVTSPVSTSNQSSSPKDNAGMKILKGMHGTNIHGNRSELTIEPVQLQSRKNDAIDETAVPKRKDITISPIEMKKAKTETKLTHILPEVTIQPIIPREQKQQIMFEAKAGSISRQQMNVISQEISITQVRSNKPMDLVMTDKLKSMLTKNPQATNNDCEIIEHRPELIIVNENSNSSQDVMIIEEVPVLRSPETKIPKKRGRPRRNPLPIILTKPTSSSVAPGESMMQRDPLALDDIAQLTSHMGPKIFPPIESEAPGRPKRMCRNQKSYAPPRRGRRRGGRGKRKMDMSMELEKRPRIEQDLDMIERSTTGLISIHEPPANPPKSTIEPQSSCNTSELYKALRQPTMDRKMPNAIARNEIEMAVNDTRNNTDLITKSQLESFMDARIMSHLDGVINKTSANETPYDENVDNDRKLSHVDISSPELQNTVNLLPAKIQKSQLSAIDDKIIEKIVDETKDNKDTSSAIDHENWLTPSSKKQCDGRNEGNISNVQVMDEETRMSAESGSRSQTPAKNMSVQASETIVNEESQGSVLSTATTESEKVKVKSRRMEINFDPDEGPFTVDKIAEYDWPQDPLKKNETFMIQEQISHYLGVKSFKRKYPDLKRRMVDMEERNYLRENALVSEAMCDMGLTAVLSAEVLDIMCSDFPDQYEEYRKHIREKQMKEHFKKQKELTAAANAEKNRIDLAEMAVQSALSWNVGLNKARRESRKCSLDLQTFTIHVPKKQQKIEDESNSNHYPVALIPGQYTDYYREYTPAELRYYPLNTVLYGPMRPNERKFDSQSEGSQSDSDSDSSSDDSSSSSSEGTQDTEASQSTMDDVDAELSRQKEDIKSIKCKMCLKHLNKFSRTEVLIQCGTCNGYVHPSCIDLTLDMVPHIQAYAWQCTDCKTCAQCHDPADEDKMLFCDMCDRGYHIYCVGLRRVPQGRWHCQECAVCASCGSREAGGTNSDRNSVAQWQHEYKKGDKNTRVYVSTLCVPCSKLWRKGRYCPHCSRCHTVQRLDLEVNLVHCSACDKYLHLGCVESKDLTIDRKNYRCDFCQSLRHHMVKPLVSKVFRM